MPQDLVYTEEIIEDDEDVDDYTIVIGADGNIKTLIIPEDYIENVPETVQIILELLGIDDINKLNSRTLH